MFAFLIFLNKTKRPFLGCLLLTICSGYTGLSLADYRKWAGLLFVLLFLGGIIVLFLYITALQRDSTLGFTEGSRQSLVLLILGLGSIGDFNISETAHHDDISILFQGGSFGGLAITVFALYFILVISLKLLGFRGGAMKANAGSG